MKQFQWPQVKYYSSKKQLKYIINFEKELIERLFKEPTQIRRRRLNSYTRYSTFVKTAYNLFKCHLNKYRDK